MSAGTVTSLIGDATEYQHPDPLPLLRKLPAGGEFPIAALGNMLSDAANGIHEKVQAPLAICGQSILAMATFAAQAHANVVLPTGHAKPLSSFFLTVAATGERKSACDIEALWPLRKRETALREAQSAALQLHQNDKAAWDKAREHILKSGKGDRTKITGDLQALGSEPQAPLSPILTCPEPTFEGLCKLFAIGQGSLGVFSAEGGQFIGGHGMSEDKKLGMATGLSGLWDGEPIRRVRVLDGASMMPGRRLTVHLMAQPDVASLMLCDRMLLDQGLLSRVLVTAPTSTSGTRLWRDPSAEAEAAIRHYGAVLLSMMESPPCLAEGSANELTPRHLPLSADAREMWIGFSNHVERLISPGGEMEPIKGLANKLAEHAARLAAVLALVTDLHTGEVSPVHMAAGMELAQHYADEALRVFSASRVGADLMLAQKTLDWLHQSWKEDFISLPDLYQVGPADIRAKEKASRIAAILEDHRWLRKAHGSILTKGSKRREGWSIVKGAQA